MQRTISLLQRILDHELSGYIVIGLLLRMLLMPYFIDPYDIGAYRAGLVYFLNGYDPYFLHASIYPPLVYFLTFPLFTVAYHFGFSLNSLSVLDLVNGNSANGIVAISQVDPWFLVLWKLPLLCFDVLTGIVIYSFVKEIAVDFKQPKRLFLVWFFNPFTLVISYVHGSYDVLVAFFILLGAFLLYRGNYLSSGLCFGLGTLAKTAPIFVALPLSVILLLKGVGRSLSIAVLKTNARAFLRFVAGISVSLLPFAPLLTEYSYLMYMGISREISITGGLNQWFFTADLQRTYWINQYVGTIQLVFSYFPLICIIVSLVFCKFLEFGQKRILLAVAFFTGFIYFFLPITLQSQYLLWVLPLLVVISAIKKHFLWILGLCSAAGFFFYLSIQSPRIFLYPLAMYTSLYKPEELIQYVSTYLNAPGVFSRYLRQDLCTLFGGIGFVGLLSMIILLIVNLWVTKNEERR